MPYNALSRTCPPFYFHLLPLLHLMHSPLFSSYNKLFLHQDFSPCCLHPCLLMDASLSSRSHFKGYLITVFPNYTKNFHKISITEFCFFHSPSHIMQLYYMFVDLLSPTRLQFLKSRNHIFSLTHVYSLPTIVYETQNVLNKYALNKLVNTYNAKG